MAGGGGGGNMGKDRDARVLCVGILNCKGGGGERCMLNVC